MPEPVPVVFDTGVFVQAALRPTGPAAACLSRVDAGRIMLLVSEAGLQDAPSRFRFPRDPDDEHILNLALEVGARYLVSRDNDLLDLAEDKQFVRCYPTLCVTDPVAFLREMASLHAGA